MRIVFDTNVLARAHQFAHGPARRGLLFVATGSDVLILSQYLLQELRRILAYPRVMKSSGLTSLDISEYLDYLARVSTLVHPLPVPEKLRENRRTNPCSVQHWQETPTSSVPEMLISSLKKCDVSAPRVGFK